MLNQKCAANKGYVFLMDQVKFLKVDVYNPGPNTSQSFSLQINLNSNSAIVP